MSAFEGILIGVALTALVVGFLVGHYHANAQLKSLLLQLGPGLKADLTAAEAEMVAVFRKVTKRDAVAADPAPSTPPPAA
jgi:hypothetical protein